MTLLSRLLAITLCLVGFAHAEDPWNQFIDTRINYHTDQYKEVAKATMMSEFAEDLVPLEKKLHEKRLSQLKRVKTLNDAQSKKDIIHIDLLQEVSKAYQSLEAARTPEEIKSRRDHLQKCEMQLQLFEKVLTLDK